MNKYIRSFLILSATEQNYGCVKCGVAAGDGDLEDHAVLGSNRLACADDGIHVDDGLVMVVIALEQGGALALNGKALGGDPVELDGIMQIIVRAVVFQVYVKLDLAAGSDLGGALKSDIGADKAMLKAHCVGLEVFKLTAKLADHAGLDQLLVSRGNIVALAQLNGQRLASLMEGVVCILAEIIEDDGSKSYYSFGQLGAGVGQLFCG